MTIQLGEEDLLNGMAMVFSGDTDDSFSVHSEEINPSPAEEDGRVRHLVNSFETLLSAPDCINSAGRGRVRRKWTLPALQRPICLAEEDQNFDINQYRYGGRDSDKMGVRTAAFVIFRSRGEELLKMIEILGFGGLQVQRLLSSSARELSLGKNGANDQKHILKFTPAQPFRLLTEQRGHIKEQEFMKKLKEMLAEEAKRRIPVAQGLPWTTDMPQILSKPPVKGRTKPLDIKLHTQIRAVERAEFDHFVAEKLYFLEQQRLEEERLQKLLEEEEIKKLRKEMVPRAQIMPFFDRPFMPRRSTRRLTIPKEPKFHITHHRRECLSCNSL